jgi:hypothetical protein
LIEKRDLKNGDVVWGCAFNIDFDRQAHFGDGVTHAKQEPIKGIINNSYFYVLKKDGSPRANGVSIYSRSFANTYEECVEIYNGKIEDKIAKLSKVVGDLLNQIIK